MATYHDVKIKTAQAKAVVSRAHERAAPPGPLILTAALSLACFLSGDYLLFTPCEGDGESEPGLLQSHLWGCSSGWLYFTLSRLFLSGVVFVVLCVGVACLLGCCGFKATRASKGSLSSM